MVTLPRLLQISEDLASLVLYFLFALRYAESTWWEGTVGAHLRWISDNGFTIGSVLALYIFGSKVTRYFTGDRLTNRKEVKRILDSLQKSFFQGFPTEEQFKHRVTLFKAHRKWWPWGRLRRLKIYARSGTRYQKSSTCFDIDDESEDGNTGVAGQAWFKDAQVTVTELPAWPDDVGAGSEQVRNAYAKSGFVSRETAEKLEIKSRSIAATVVRNQQGERWGVLVVDSREPKGVELNTEKKSMITLVADLLSAQL